MFRRSNTELFVEQRCVKEICSVDVVYLTYLTRKRVGQGEMACSELSLW